MRFQVYIIKTSPFRAHIPRDGNCLFRAFAEAMYHDQGQQDKLREQAVQTVVNHWDKYSVGIEEAILHLIGCIHP